MSSPGTSLHQLILAGDPDAIAGFRDSHVHRIRRYVAEACPPELRDEAADATFVNFLGRVATAQDGNLEELLLNSTRSCAAGRFDVQAPAGAHRHAGAPEPVCLAMPELLAAFANDELPGQHDAAQHHLDHCPTCAATAERMARAEQAFTQAPAWEAAPEQWLAVADRDGSRDAGPQEGWAASEGSAQAGGWQAPGEPEPPHTRTRRRARTRGRARTRRRARTRGRGRGAHAGAGARTRGHSRAATRTQAGATTATVPPARHRCPSPSGAVSSVPRGERSGIGSRGMRARICLLLAAGALGANLAAPHAGAASLPGPTSLSTGFADDTTFESLDPALRTTWLDRARGVSSSWVRLAVPWFAVAPPQLPPGFNAASASDPHYYWAGLDAAVRDATAHRQNILMMIMQAPTWAYGPNPPSPDLAPAWRPDVGAFGAFSHAVAQRYSGRFPDPLQPGRKLPRVSYFQAWNEPNLRTSLMPQWVLSRGHWVPASPGYYRRMLNAFYANVKAVQPHAYVLAAGLAPYGDPPGVDRMGAGDVPARNAVSERESTPS